MTLANALTFLLTVSRGVSRAGHHARNRTHRRGRGPSDESEDPVPVVCDGLSSQIPWRVTLGQRSGRHRSRITRRAGEVAENGEKSETPDTVGHHMAHLDDRGRATSLESLYNSEGPERASLVETRHRRLAREFQHAVEGSIARRTNPADVVRQIEIRVDEPAGRRQAKGHFHQPVPQRGKGTAGTFKAVQQRLAVGWSIEDENRSHRLSQQGILLDSPQHRFHVAGMKRFVRRLSVNVDRCHRSSVAVPTSAVRVPGVCATRSQRGGIEKFGQQSRRGTGRCMRFGRRRRI